MSVKIGIILKLSQGMQWVTKFYKTLLGLIGYYGAILTVVTEKKCKILKLNSGREEFLSINTMVR